MRSSVLVSTLVSLSALSAAWPWGESSWQDVKGVQGIEPLLYRRQDSSASPSPTPAPSSSASASSSSDSSSDSDSSTGSNSGSSTSGSQTGSQSGSQSGSSSSGSKSGSSSGSSGSSRPTGLKSSVSSASQSFDPRLPAGGVAMVTPAPTAQTTYYKIGDHVTFAWNYTSLSVTPHQIDVLATCTANNHLYTLSANMSVNPTDTIVWDTNAYQKHPPDGTSLLTETYTLVIHDAAQDVSATAAAGYLGTYEQFTFGMYSPQAYTPLDQYSCATCKVNAALTTTERQTLAVLLATGAITVLSFSWFATGFGLF
ncbi:hypothetical protein EV356DRAFT_514310 [Viridothelium virens]|uniref:DUF7137 domain-containing protein n=1 Tax=Viridothelium virens TaxID=1048519 RepID=A0A6A6HCD4_VIRVR|nr:hypothetical protein EV356DRAFT_514310 [Viridothelium virens]